MEATSKCSPESTTSGDVSGKFMDLLREHDDDDDAAELFPEIPIKEELIEEVMQELYKEITYTSDCYTNISSSPATMPSPSLAASFVVGNGKSESCGASVSDSASTVMVGVEFVGSGERLGGVKKTEVGNGSSSSAVGKGYGEGEVDGCNSVEVDDEWLARVLSWGPVELEPWI
ncbi:uncharacterized protein LOC125423045 [Ziziphus jujuba]|uniref:Uncharacterized protein LOC125423045 n=1 Tax=Ziziphus jujuba TaxID=326968 RepID=A0ABM3INE2_ZIZJJ|nr:uncharacterized protein LOC125423045 [Ziziphus jujuba]